MRSEISGGESGFALVRIALDATTERLGVGMFLDNQRRAIVRVRFLRERSLTRDIRHRTAPYSNRAYGSEAADLLVKIFQDASDTAVRRSRQTSHQVDTRTGSKFGAGIISTLVKLISEYFTSEELRAVLRLYLSRDAYDIFPSGVPLRLQISSVIEAAERGGWTSQLLEALSDFSRSHEFRAALDSYSRPASAKLLKVFLSHAAEDKPAVRETYQRLLLDGFAPWLNEEDLLPGQDWSREIERAVGDPMRCLSFSQEKPRPRTVTSSKRSNKHLGEPATGPKERSSSFPFASMIARCRTV